MKLALALALIATPAAADTVSGVTINSQRYVSEQTYEAAPLIDNDAETSGAVIGTDFPVTKHLIGLASLTAGFAPDDPKLRVRAGLAGEWGRWDAGIVYEHVGQRCGPSDTGARTCASGYSVLNASFGYDFSGGWEIKFRAMNATNYKYCDCVGAGDKVGARYQVELWKHWGRD